MEETSDYLLAPKRIKLDSAPLVHSATSIEDIFNKSLWHVIAKIFSYLDSTSRLSAVSAFRSKLDISFLEKLQREDKLNETFYKLLIIRNPILECIDFVKLEQNFRQGKTTELCLSFDVSNRDNDAPIASLTQRYLAVVSKELVSRENLRSRVGISSIQLRNTQTGETVHKISIPLAYNKSECHLGITWWENILVYRVRKKIYFWDLDSYKIYTLLTPYTNGCNWFCGSGLLACWVARKGMTVYEVKKDHEPRRLRTEYDFPGTIVRCEAGPSFDCLVCETATAFIIQLRQKHDFSVVREIEACELISSPGYATFKYKRFSCSIDEFIVKPTEFSKCSLEVLCTECNKLVHLFTFGSPSFIPMSCMSDFSVRWAFGRLFAWSQKGELFYWDVPAKLIQSWRDICKYGDHSAETSIRTSYMCVSKNVHFDSDLFKICFILRKDTNKPTRIVIWNFLENA